MFHANAALGAAALAFFHVKIDAPPRDWQVLHPHLAFTVNGGVNCSTMGAYQLAVVRERYNEMMVAVGAVEDTDDDSVWEFE
jgi:hypothetical protein